MDKTTTPEEGKSIFKGDRATKLKNIIENFQNDNLLTEVSINLPVGFHKTYSSFKRIDMEEGQNVPWYIIPMKITVKKERGDLSCALVQKFTMNISKGFKPLKSEFFYKWDYSTNMVTITRFLSSTKKATIQENAKKLLKECQLFYELHKEQSSNNGTYSKETVF